MKKKKVWIPAIIAIVAVALVFIFVVNPSGGSDGNPNGSNPNNNHDPPPIESNWIRPGKVFIGNYTAGASISFEIEIHNGGDNTAEFSVAYRFPDGVIEGYSKPPSGVPNWLYFRSGDVRGRRVIVPVESRGTCIVQITLKAPEGSELPNKWEFWIGVIDKSQTGMVITELASRVLVTMQ